MSKQYTTNFGRTLNDLIGGIRQQTDVVRGVDEFIACSYVDPKTVAALKRISTLAAAALAYIDEVEERKEGSHE